MKTTFYLNGKKTTRKALTEMLGADRLKRYIEEAKETFFEDRSPRTASGSAAGTCSPSNSTDTAFKSRRRNTLDCTPLNGQ